MRTSQTQKPTAPSRGRSGPPRLAVAAGLGLASAGGGLLLSLALTGREPPPDPPAPMSPAPVTAPTHDSPAATMISPETPAARELTAELLRSWDVPPESLAAPPKVLAGTDVDGALATDASGHLDPTREARRLFDYFFTASGTEPDAVIRGRVVAHILRTLRPPADAEAIAVLDAYLRAREETRQLEQLARDQKLDPLTQLERVRALRRDVLGPVLAERFYAEDEAWARVGLARRAIVASGLEGEELERRLRAFDAQLPVADREATVAARAPFVLRQQVQEMRAQGASEEEIFAARERAAGREAAQRLAELDARRARFDQAWRDYAPRRDSIRADPRLSPEERERRLESLRRDAFPPEDLVRVRALDATP